MNKKQRSDYKSFYFNLQSMKIKFNSVEEDGICLYYNNNILIELGTLCIYKNKDYWKRFIVLEMI